MKTTITSFIVMQTTFVQGVSFRKVINFDYFGEGFSIFFVISTNKNETETKVQSSVLIKIIAF